MLHSETYQSELHWELMIYRSTCVQWIMIVRAFLVQMPFTKDLMTEDTNMKIKNKTQCHRAQLGEAPSVPAEPLFADPGGPRPIGSYCPGPGCRADNVHLNAVGFVTHNSRGKLWFWVSETAASSKNAATALWTRCFNHSNVLAHASTSRSFKCHSIGIRLASANHF